MPRLHLVRHGHAAASWGDHPDPGLDDVGRAEAERAAAALAPLGPLPVVSSPLRRARETAAPIAARWHADVRIDAAVGEVPSPNPDLTARAEWLPRVLTGTWRELDDAVARWRIELIDALLALPGDTVVVSHFVAINAVVGWAAGDDRVTVFRPANASVTVLDTHGRALSVHSLGAQLDTRVG